MLCIFLVDISIPISKKQYDTSQINTNVILKLQFFLKKVHLCFHIFVFPSTTSWRCIGNTAKHAWPHRL